MALTNGQYNADTFPAFPFTAILQHRGGEFFINIFSVCCSVVSFLLLFVRHSEFFFRSLRQANKDQLWKTGSNPWRNWALLESLEFATVRFLGQTS